MKPVEIALQGAGRFPELAPARLRRWLEELLGAAAPGVASLGVRFTGDRTMRQLNRRFRRRDRTTDVLSFPGARSPEGWHVGDIVVSVPAARRQAASREHPVDREVRLLLLHGLLHCLGHDHETDDGAMARLERRLRRRWVR